MKDLRSQISGISDLARMALPLMDPARRAEAEQLLDELGRTANAEEETLQEWTRRAAAAFAADMKPIVDAVVVALHDGDLAALRGLRALLPELLANVNQSPVLADLLAHQLGTAFLEGLTGRKKGDGQ